MFDFDAGKLLIIGVVALIVIGPKDLPRVLRQVGQAVGKLRRMAGEFQGQFMEAMKEADIQDIKDEMAKLGSHADLNVNFDPARDIQKELTEAVTPSTALGVAMPEAATDHYALPHVPEPQPEPDDTTWTEASAGYAPVVQDLPTDDHHALIEHGGSRDADPTPVGEQKRKIVLRKRRPQQQGPSGHDGSMRAGPRFRNVRPRRQEASDQ